jgi:cytochrome c oxidase subunit 2
MRRRFIPVFILFLVLPCFGRLVQVDGSSVRTPHRVQIMAQRYSFQPASVTLKVGEPVVLVLQSQDVAHGLHFQGLDLDLKAPKGRSTQATFTPTKAGVFVGHCSVFCGAGHGGMTLTLNVEP